jgi:hypothetical protein
VRLNGKPRQRHFAYLGSYHDDPRDFIPLHWRNGPDLHYRVWWWQLRERLDPLAREVQHPDRLPLAHQRDAKHRPYLCDRDRLRDLVFLVVSKVGNLQRPALDNHASSHSFPSCGEGVMVKKGLLQPFQSTKAEALEG